MYIVICLLKAGLVCHINSFFDLKHTKRYNEQNKTLIKIKYGSTPESENSHSNN